MQHLANKTVIITGSTRGIGKTTAFAFLAAGANVVINGRSKEKMAEIQREFADKGFHPLAVVADVSCVNDCKFLVRSALEKFGRIDYLINNAGLSIRGRFEDLRPETIPEIITSNLLTALYATRTVLPEIIKTRGSIVFISSFAAIHGIPNLSLYSAAKAGMEAFTESLRIELLPYKVHVGLIHVGIVDNYPDKKVMGHDGSYITVSRKGQISEEEVAQAVLRMVSRRRTMMNLTLLAKLMYFLEKVSPTLVHYFLRFTMDSEKYK